MKGGVNILPLNKMFWVNTMRTAEHWMDFGALLPSPSPIPSPEKVAYN